METFQESGATSFAQFRAALIAQIQMGQLTPAQANQAFTVYSTSGPVPGALVAWNQLMGGFSAQRISFRDALASFAAFVRDAVNPRSSSRASLSGVRLAFDIKHDRIILPDVRVPGRREPPIGPPWWKKDDDKVALCGVEKFVYPAFVADFDGHGFPVNLTEKPSQLAGAIGVPRWRYGLLFDGEAQFIKGGQLQCGCCEFRQYVLRMVAFVDLPDPKNRLNKATPRIQKLLDDIGDSYKLRSDNVYWSEEAQKWITTYEYGDREHRMTPGTNVDSFTLDTYLDPATWAAKEHEIKGLVRQDQLNALRSHKEHLLGGLDIATRKGGAAWRAEHKFVDNWTKHGTVPLRRRACHHYFYDTPQLWSVEGREQFELILFVGMIKPVRGRQIGTNVTCTGGIRSKFGVSRVKAFGYWTHFRWPVSAAEPYLQYELWIPEKYCDKSQLRLSAPSGRHAVRMVDSLFAGDPNSIPARLANTPRVQIKQGIDGPLQTVSGVDARRTMRSSFDHAESTFKSATQEGDSILHKPIDRKKKK